MSKVSGDQCNCPGNHLQSSGSPLLRRWIECQNSSFATKNPGKTDCSWICFIIHDFQVSYVGKLPWIYAVMFTWNDTFESLDLRIFTFQVDIPNKIIKIRVRDRSKELLRNLCASNQMALQHHGNPKIAGLEPLHLSHFYHGCNLLQIWAINLHPDTIQAKYGKIIWKNPDPSDDLRFHSHVFAACHGTVGAETHKSGFAEKFSELWSLKPQIRPPSLGMGQFSTGSAGWHFPILTLTVMQNMHLTSKIYVQDWASLNITFQSFQLPKSSLNISHKISSAIEPWTMQCQTLMECNVKC